MLMAAFEMIFPDRALVAVNRSASENSQPFSCNLQGAVHCSLSAVWI